MLRKLTRLINGLVSLVTAVALLICGLYACYALWDNQQIYNAAENVRADMLRLKPRTDEDEPVDPAQLFAGMLEINPDVCGWISMDNTRVDYPVLQGRDNAVYINTDVYGEFSLAGSIFLDSRCVRDFTGRYMLVHGHHMAQGVMFGDLDLYKEEPFFNKFRTGTLTLPDGNHQLDIFAYLLVNAADDNIFDPYRWQDDVSGLMDFVRKRAVFIHQDVMDELEASQDGDAYLPIVALATCSSEFSDARTIILTVMRAPTP